MMHCFLFTQEWSQEKKLLGRPNRNNKVLEGAKKGRKSILLENIYIEATFDYGGAMASLTPP